MNVLYFCFRQLNDLDNQQFINQEMVCFFPETRIFTNENIEIVSPSPKNNNPNIYASFLIIAKLLFVFC